MTLSEFIYECEKLDDMGWLIIDYDPVEMYAKFRKGLYAIATIGERHVG